MITAKKDSPLDPIDKMEMNRMAHARAQELRLPGSPPGKNGHRNLSIAANNLYGVRSWSDLNVDQMKKIYTFLDDRKRLPVQGELRE